MKLANNREFDPYTIAANIHEALKDMDFADYEDTAAGSIEKLTNALYEFGNLAHYQDENNYLHVVADTLITLFGE